MGVGADRPQDPDPAETREWLDALQSVVERDGPGRAEELLGAVLLEARSLGIEPAGDLVTPYRNTIPAGSEPEVPGDPAVEHRLRSLVRWNAMMMVLRANAESSELGGHIASFQSAATLYEVGFNHHWRADDLIYVQGHSSPGIYARAFLEGRLSEADLERFRREVGEPGLSSYPHPWLMPSFWQFPTVSMGLGPLMAIHQARFMTYLQGRGLADTDGRKVWAFMGDGEMDEPESMGAIGDAGREHLDNLVFVVNCNLQRLDGPVRGNAKIIQELESEFRGAGWNVIKVVWGTRWDPLLAADHEGHLQRRMDEVVDGDYQVYKARDGAYVRERFFGASPELAKMVEHLSDEEIWQLNRGGHDPVKVHAAYAAAAAHTGQPTVILAKTIKGYGMGEAGEGQNVTHQQKKMGEGALFAFRDRFDLPLTDDQVRDRAYVKPADDDPVVRYLRERRDALGGPLPVRPAPPGFGGALEVPPLEAWRAVLDGTGDRESSTTTAFVRVLLTALRDPEIGPRVVPIVPDESRTFGMEPMFQRFGIFSRVGQRYEAEDAGSLAAYRESSDGQMLQMGIDEAGAMAIWLAAATAYANHGVATVPFYVFYSMFGFQRVGDLAWAAGDSRARGFLIGGTSGRTTLSGEGLQHEDGHSHLLSSVIPNCRSYDPAFGYEVAVIVQDGLRRMLAEPQEDGFVYLTVGNEPKPQPAMPDGAADGVLRGLHRVSEPAGPDGVQLLGSGAILREVLAARELLASGFDVDSEVWSATSFTELARDGQRFERARRLGLDAGDEPWLARCLDGRPTVAATDYVRAVPEQVRAWVPGPFTVLGTDGYGRSDTRASLRRFFEVDRGHVVVAALRALGRDDDARRAMERFEIEPEEDPPWER